MSLATGTRIGHYQVTGSLGAGGMGEVYRARDTKLDRDVALKILPETFAGDPERRARFTREAKTLAALNHTHIAQIYGVEDSGATSALVMELVDGEDLSERIRRGPLSYDDAITIAKQIAQALEAAHEQGIIHRDLKPANIKLRDDGTIKILDFGLAKALDPASAGTSQRHELANSPTITSPAGVTLGGVILGTAAYMSPEQAKGRVVDKRADVWAFGAVLYEMLTGQQAFRGEGFSDTLASVIRAEPDWSKLPADTPPSIRRLLTRCLTKDPKQRLRECGSALLDIQDAERGAEATTIVGRTPMRHSWFPLVAVATLAAAAGAGAWALLSRPAPTNTPPIRRSTITLPEGDYLPTGAGTILTIAPDGRAILYTANRGSERRVYKRDLAQFEATMVSGIDGGFSAFSPDGTWIVYEENRFLKRIPSDGGPAQTLATLNTALRGLAWTVDGNVILGSNSVNEALRLAPITGGTTTELVKPPQGRRAAYPDVFRHGSAVLFTIGAPTNDPGELHALRLDTSEQKLVLREAAAGRVLPTGHLVFVRAGTLWAVPFDEDRIEVRGTPVPVIEGIRVENGGAVQYGVSNDGTVVFVPGTFIDREQRPLQLVSPDGQVRQVPGSGHAFMAAVLSPDGTRIAVQIEGTDDADVWVVEIARGALTRLTTESGYDGSPVWSPDGRSVAFVSLRGDEWRLQRRAADGTGPVELITTVKQPSDGTVRPTGWTAHGEILMSVGLDIGVVQADAKSGWKPLIQAPAGEFHGVVSPDGRWISYASNETGAAEVYVQRFPDLGDRQLVSVGGGYLPTWSRDGRALFYLHGQTGGLPQDLRRATVEPTRDGRLRISAPTKVADWTFYVAQLVPRFYDVTADGRVVVIGRTSSTTARQINVITNWSEELKRLVPVQ